MTVKKYFRDTIALLLFLFTAQDPLFSAPPQGMLDRVSERIQSLVDEGKLVGCQVAVGQDENVLVSGHYGVRSKIDQTAVDSETMFCIGSCSKPIASAVVMTLVDDEVVELDKGIDSWLSAFGKLKTAEGEPSRSPTMAELLSHQGGIYSQKKGMNGRQARWIRDFRLTLEESVDAISKEPLLARPGTEYAYSGAGYCVLGRVAEVAADKSFEDLLRSRLCEPLGLKRTSFFPEKDDGNVAAGSVNGKISRTTPHLSEPFNLPLIGGSLYSTAGDCAVFLQAVLKQVKSGEEALMSSDQFESYTTPYSDKKNYAFGWSTMRANGEAFGLMHSGALASSRALFQVNHQTGIYVVILYSLADPSETPAVGRALGQVIRPLIAPKRPQ